MEGEGENYRGLLQRVVGWFMIFYHRWSIFSNFRTIFIWFSILSLFWIILLDYFAWIKISKTNRIIAYILVTIKFYIEKCNEKWKLLLLSMSVIDVRDAFHKYHITFRCHVFYDRVFVTLKLENFKKYEKGPIKKKIHFFKNIRASLPSMSMDYFQVFGESSFGEVSWFKDLGYAFWGVGYLMGLKRKGWYFSRVCKKKKKKRISRKCTLSLSVQRLYIRIVGSNNSYYY